MSIRNGKPIKAEDVVISGISGVFPQSDNVEEFKENLLQAKDLIQENERWGKEYTDIPSRAGLVRTLDRFDHSFFRIHRRQVEKMSASSRILMEKSFEAIVDAGYNPEQLKGANIGVFDGNYANGSSDDYQGEGINEYSVHASSQSLNANRISYWLDVNGPSLTIDTACSSSLYAFECAYKSIQNGDCDAALVCSANVNLSPTLSRTFATFGILDPEGISQPFDAEARGFVRAESGVVVFLQKLKDARRVYANVLNAKTNCDGFKREGMACPSGKFHKKLYEQFYQEINIDPRSVSYIEAHGTGTEVGDVVEVNAIEEYFCAGRDTPLKIGSVKSNTGHCEQCSGLCSIAKLIISFETGIIPPTINLKNPKPEIKGLHNGRIEVITKPTPCDGQLFGINSFGVGGANAHVLLSPHNKVKNLANSTVNDELPYLVTVSGRTEEAVNVIVENLKKNSTDAEYIRLMHEIFSENISGHLYRGYVVLNKENEVEKRHKFFTGEKQPIWFIFSGMGSQWPSMGKSLMKIPIFAKSIRKCHAILESKGVNLIRIVTENDSQIFKNILNSFVGIAAIQIALCDILKAIGIEPDGIIGHSVGELGCAYADGCFTAEEMILAAYYRGLVSLETEFIHGTMAAVGASYDNMKDLIPPEIDIACHNSASSCTISGPTDIVEDFIKELKQKEIFVRQVNTSNIAYHSRYIASAGPALISHLSNIIPNPKPRSEKWICTSAPECEWSTEKAKYSSAEYHTNNLLNPVYFEESSRHIPENAIAIEIAPHGLLQAILKRSLPSTTNNVPLTLRDHQNGVEFLLNALGQLYEVGCVPKLSNLYPQIEFPVSRSTPMISPLIKWQHEDTWPVTKFAKTTTSGERDIFIRPQSEDSEYLKGHVVDGRNLYPAMGYLALIWETVAIMNKTNYKKLSVVFENVRFERATVISKQDFIEFHVSIQQATGRFEITNRGALVVSGIVRVPEDIEKEKVPISFLSNSEISDSSAISLNKKDFYKELRLRGYHYKGIFKNVVQCNTKGTYGRSTWCNNFVTFMDTMGQISILSVDARVLIIPTFIRKVVIDVNEHSKVLETLEKENPELPVHYDRNQTLIYSGGIQMIGWRGTSIARRKDQQVPVLEKYQFVPYISDDQMDLDTAVRLCVHIALENLPTLKVKIIELLMHSYDGEVPPISTSIANTLGDLPLIQASVNLFTNSELETTIKNPEGITILNGELPSDKSCLIVVLSDLWNKVQAMDKIFEALKDGGYIIAEECEVQNEQLGRLGLNICFSRVIDGNKKILLLRKIVPSNQDVISIKLENSTYSWLPTTQLALSTIKDGDKKLVIYADRDSSNGILGFFNCLRREEYGEKTRCFFLMDNDMPAFSLHNSFYKNQFDKDLTHNVYKNGQWGSYRHLPLEPVNDVEVPYTYNTLEVQGDLSSFRWVEGSLNSEEYLPENPVIHVYYSALNFRDVMLTSGKISIVDTGLYNRLVDTYFGVEVSGKDENGKRYMSMLPRRGIGTMANCNVLPPWRVPDHMTLEEASTISVAYVTVVYSLFIEMNLKERSSILIHAAAGGVGQAAINICLHYNCNIFVTVGTPEKVEFIKKTFPQIPECNIGNSRDTSFEKLIMKQTNGRGVDIVLNSLSEDNLHASLRCVTFHGHFIEIGKFDMVRNNVLELGPFLKGISFHSIQLDIMGEGSEQVLLFLHKIIQQMLDDGIIKPLCRTVFDKNEVESAFRYMGAGKHIGKVVIKIRDEEEDIHAKPVPISSPARPRVLCQNINSYVIIGGLGGFGLELADWLIMRGARNLVLCSRNGLKNGYQSYKIMLWRSYGANVVISTEDVTTETGVSKLLQTASGLGPVRGIFNVAVILKDGAFDTQTEESFAISAGPKAIATQHFDKLSRVMCPQLEYFVVFSSVACGRGNANQTNYGMSNSIMEQICEARKADNLPALAIQWGAIGEVGVVADFAEDNLDIVIGGTLQQNVTSCLKTLDGFMKQPNPIVSTMIVAEKRHADSDIIHVIANILGIKDLKTISLTWTLPELGMDSIMAIELKQIIETEFGIFVSPQDLKTMTFAKLYKLKEEQENQSKSGGTHKTQYQLYYEEKFLNAPLLRIPFHEGGLNEEIPVQNNPTVFIFPGVEGLAKFMEPLAKNLTPQVLCFQYFMEKTNSTVQSYCELFLNHIIQRLGPDQEFYIIAYSIGTIFALEVVKLLEAQGRKGYIWCLDGSPDYLLSWKENEFVKFNVNGDEAIQCFTCVTLLQKLVPERIYEELSEHIQKVDGWEQKKKFCSSIFPKKIYSDSTICKFLDTIYALLKEISTYKGFTGKLETSCTLIRCVENKMHLDEYYGLSKSFKHSVEIHHVEANHYDIVEKEKTADIIMENPIWKTK